MSILYHPGFGTSAMSSVPTYEHSFSNMDSSIVWGNNCFRIPVNPISSGLYVPGNFNATLVPVIVNSESCGTNMTDMLANSTVQIPVPVVVNTSTGMPASSIASVPLKRRPLENELIVDPSSTLPYLPPPVRKCNVQKEPCCSRSSNVTGMSKWYAKWKSEHSHQLRRVKSKAKRSQKALKRLTNKVNRKILKREKRDVYEDREWIRESKLKLLQRKGIKAAPKTSCDLWNCTKQFKRRDIYMPLDPGRKTPSQLSDLSARSRSPIRFS